MEPQLVRHHDDESYDEIRIRVIPRFKTSGMSGDEWRVSAVTEFLRKGEVIYTETTGKMEWAAAKLPGLFLVVGERLPAELFRVGDDKCAQPGCSEPFVSEYRLKSRGCSRCGGRDDSPYPGWDQRIRFCQKHLHRGDSDLTDNDENYEVVSGPGPAEARGYENDVSEAAQVFITQEQLEAGGLREAVDKARGGEDGKAT